MVKVKVQPVHQQRGTQDTNFNEIVLNVLATKQVTEITATVLE